MSEIKSIVSWYLNKVEMRMGVSSAHAIPNQCLTVVYNEVQQLIQERERLELLIKIADELITNDNAKKDWEDAKRLRNH